LTANGNTFFGSTAGSSTRGGGGNSAFGISALSQNISGTNNVAIGRQAAYYSVTASDLVAVGNNALFYYTGSGSNTAVGSAALFGNATIALNTGTENAALGASAGIANTSGSQNVFIGHLAGNNNTTGSQNTYLGYNAGTTNITDNYQIAIGQGVSPVGTNKGAIGRNANATRTDIGIGTYSPLARMHIETLASGNMGLYIAGSASQTADLLEVNATTNGVNYFTITGIGSVGVNTASPTSILHVNGDLRNDGRIILNSNNANLVNQRIFAGINSSINQTSFVGIASINIPLGYQLTIEGKINGWFSSSLNESGRFFAVFNNSIGIASLVGLTDITSKFVGSSGNFDIQAQGTNAVIVTKSNNTANMWLWKASYDYLITQNV